MSEPASRTARFSLILLIALSAGEFVFRGPLRFLLSIEFNDFISPVAQTRAWLKGVDPYAPATLPQFWPLDVKSPNFFQADLASGAMALKHGIPTAYPPTFFVLLTPFAMISSWRLSAVVWIALCTALFAVMLVALWRYGNFTRQEETGYLLIAFAVGLAPLHTGFATGSITILAVPICVLAYYCAPKREIVAAVLTAVAVGLKPQIGLPLLCYFALRKQWKIVSFSTSILAVMAAIAAARLAFAHTLWLSSYARDNTILLAHGSLGDFTELNPLRFGLVNCQVLTYAILGKRSIANLAGISVAGVLGLAWLYLFGRTAEPKRGILAVSALFVISLLPVYHRFYDASLLIFPLIWACLALRNFAERRHGIIILGLLTPFLIPGGTILQQLTAYERIPLAIGQSWWWRMVIMPHEIWALLLLAVVLLSAMRASTKMELSL